jgi:hypothetical protein
MKSQAWIGVALLTLLTAGGACDGQAPCNEPRLAGAPWRLAPTGGWFPYGGGLLRWWPRDCFPHGGGPDDYCRKPLPSVCWPAYPSCYNLGATGDLPPSRQLPAGKQGSALATFP